MEENLIQNIRFHNVREQADDSWKTPADAMWRKFVPGLTDDEIKKRMDEVVFALRGHSGEVVGVSTAYKLYVKRLRNYLYAFRCFIIPQYRIPGLTSALIIRTRDHLEKIHHQDGPLSERCVGMITMVENKRFSEHRREAIWPASKMIYIGETKDGNQIRVYYFEHAGVLADNDH